MLPFIVLLCGGMTLIFPYIGLFEDPTRKVCLNSFLIALLNPIQTIFLIFFNLAVVYISLSSPERLLTAIYLFTFGGFALWSFLNVRLTDQIFSNIQEGEIFEKKSRQVGRMFTEYYLNRIKFPRFLGNMRYTTSLLKN
ncbi:MAG: hypothetical protein ACLT8H_09680 [Streptococcus parasanguinis]